MCVLENASLTPSTLLCIPVFINLFGACKAGAGGAQSSDVGSAHCPLVTIRRNGRLYTYLKLRLIIKYFTPIAVCFAVSSASTTQRNKVGESV